MIKTFAKVAYYRMARLLFFFFQAKNKRSVHSPFLFPIIDATKEKFSKRNFPLIYNYYQFQKSCSNVLKFNEMGTRSLSLTTKVSELCRRTGHSPMSRYPLFAMVKAFNPKSILELGCGCGLTSCMLSFSGDNVVVYTVEGVEPIASHAKKSFLQFGIKNVEIFNETFLNALDAFSSSGKKIDVVLIDGSHDFDSTLLLMDRIKPILMDVSMLIVDDLHYSKSMSLAWQQLRKDDFFQVKWEFYRMGILFRNQNLNPQDIRLIY